MHPNQEHHGGGDNVRRDKITYHNFYGEGDVTIPRLLTLIPSAGFVIGRDKQLETIRERLKRNHSVVLVNGLGGIGKTTIALEYINRYGSNYQHLAWIEVTDHIATAFVTNNTLIRNLQLRAAFDQLPPETYETQGFELLLNALSNLDDCLLVIDNANQLEDLQGCRRLLRGLRATTLLTSRAHPEEWNVVPIDELAPADAIQLFFSHFLTTASGAQVERLQDALRRLGHHTLLIELIAKAATKARLTLDEVIAKINDNYLRDADLNARAISTGAHADHTGLAAQARVANYIQMVFQQISDLSETEQRYLRYLCLLPSNFYTEDFLAKVFEIDDDSKTVYLDTLESLTQKGWIAQKREAEGYTYKLHAVVQEVAVQELKLPYEEIEFYIKFLENEVTIQSTTKEIVEKFTWIPFAEYVLSIITDKDYASYADLQHWLAWLIKQTGDYKKAKILLESAKEISEKVLDANHPDIGRNYSTLGILLIDLGEYKLAAAYLEKVFNIHLQQHNKNEKAIATIQSNLANVYRELSEYNRARDLLEAALTFNIQNFGEQHPKVAVCQSGLALVYQDLGEYNKARDLLEAALANTITNFGEQHPNAAVCQSNLGWVYQELGNYKRARDLLETALASDITNFGDQHPNVAVSQSNLANVYSNLGEYNRACDLLEAALASNIINFGNSHPNIAICQSNLATVYTYLGNYNRARNLLEAALTADTKNFGDQHPHVAYCLNNLAFVEKDLGNLQEAISLFEQAHQIFYDLLGADHPNTQKVAESLADVQAQLEQSDDA